HRRRPHRPRSPRQVVLSAQPQGQSGPPPRARIASQIPCGPKRRVAKSVVRPPSSASCARAAFTAWRGWVGAAAARCSGRGGPAAAILSPDRPIRALNDSKLLAPERRETLAARIRDRALAWAVAAVDAATIDSINIYQA